MQKYVDIGRITDRADVAAKLASSPDEAPFTLREAGLLLHLSAKQIWRNIAAGNDGRRVPRFYRPAGARAWLVSAGTLRRWLRAQQGDTTITQGVAQ